MTDNFSKVPNPLDGIVITKPPKTPPIIRGRGNPIDEAAAARLVTVDEMLAKSAGVTKTRRPAKTDETPTCNETCNETHNYNETPPNAVAAVTKHGRPAKGGQPMTSAERVAAHRLRKRAAS